MTEDEIIEIIEKARQAGVEDSNEYNHLVCTEVELVAFYKLITEHEREVIWNILFEYASRNNLTPEDESLLKHLADLIKARGQE